MADRGKRGQERIRKFEYLKNKKSFLGKIKTIFNNFLRALMFLKKKKKKKIEDTSFKHNIAKLCLITAKSESIF